MGNKVYKCRSCEAAVNDTQKYCQNCGGKFISDKLLSKTRAGEVHTTAGGRFSPVRNALKIESALKKADIEIDNYVVAKSKTVYITVNNGRTEIRVSDHTKRGEDNIETFVWKKFRKDEPVELSEINITNPTQMKEVLAWINKKDVKFTKE